VLLMEAVLRIGLVRALALPAKPVPLMPCVNLMLNFVSHPHREVGHDREELTESSHQASYC
jgi:hypothetical protein